MSMFLCVLFVENVPFNCREVDLWYNGCNGVDSY